MNEIKLTQQNVRDLIFQYKGLEEGVTAREIVELLTGKRCRPNQDRVVRKIVTRLRQEGYPVGSHSSTGYFWAIAPEDLSYSQKWIKGKALHSLKVVSNMQQRAMPDLVGQTSLLPTTPKPPSQEGQTVPLAVDIPVELAEEIRAFVTFAKGEWTTNKLIAASVTLFIANFRQNRTDR